MNYVALLLLLAAVTGLPTAVFAVSLKPACPPAKPDFAYVSPSFSVQEVGSCVDGSRVWIYKPKTLKPGGADVVIYMHGYGAARPGPYQGHIEHLVKQGNYVVFPQFQEGYCELTNGLIHGIIQRLGKQSPAAWLVTAAKSTSAAVSALPSYNKIYLYGHSLGGAFGIMWGSVSDSFPQTTTAAVLASPQPAGFKAIPGYVTTIFAPLFGEDINVPAAAPQTTFPIAVLHGNDDDVAPLEDIMPSYDALGSSLKAIYQAQTDTHGRPKLKADHITALSGSGAKLQNVMDWRYLWAGLDQVMAGTNVTNLSFDLGAWSDDQPVKAVIRID